jgi:uncharacterized Zn-finger protein
MRRYMFNDRMRVPGFSRPSLFLKSGPRGPRPVNPLKKSLEDAVLFRCSVCAHKCESENGKQFHEETCHVTSEDGTTSHCCQFCDSTFRDLNSFRLHMRGHTGATSFQCHLCPKSFAQYSGRASHIRKEHTKRRYECAQCDQTFKIHSELRDHEAEHEGKPRHKCSVCGATFYKGPTYYDHKRRCKPGAVARVKGSKASEPGD